MNSNSIASFSKKKEVAYQKEISKSAPTSRSCLSFVCIPSGQVILRSVLCPSTSEKTLCHLRFRRRGCARSPRKAGPRHIMFIRPRESNATQPGVPVRSKSLQHPENARFLRILRWTMASFVLSIHNSVTEMEQRILTRINVASSWFNHECVFEMRRSFALNYMHEASGKRWRRWQGMILSREDIHARNKISFFLSFVIETTGFVERSPCFYFIILY